MSLIISHFLFVSKQPVHAVISQFLPLLLLSSLNQTTHVEPAVIPAGCNIHHHPYHRTSG